MKVSEITDPYFKDQWNIKLMNVYDTLGTATGEGVTVGIIDSGIDGSHKDFGWDILIDITANDGINTRKSKYRPVLEAIRGGTHPKVLPGWNFIENNDDTYDAYRHGTYLAGTIGALVNKYGMVGIAPDCMIKPYVVVDANGYCTQDNTIEAIRRAADNGCDVINLSLAWSYGNDKFQDAVDYANSKGTIVVAATGNNNKEQIYYPAALNGVIRVGGCDPSGKRWIHNYWRGSNYGHGITCVCPGSSQISTLYMRWRYTDVDGTSQATANMTGLVALMKSVDKSLTYNDIIDILTSLHTYKDNEVGIGVPNALLITNEVKRRADARISKYKSTMIEGIEWMVCGLVDTPYSKICRCNDICMYPVMGWEAFYETEPGKRIKRYTNMCEHGGNV